MQYFTGQKLSHCLFCAYNFFFVTTTYFRLFYIKTNLNCQFKKEMCWILDSSLNQCSFIDCKQVEEVLALADDQILCLDDT